MPSSSPTLKEILQKNNEDLQQDYENQIDISLILKKRSQTIDKLLQEMWNKIEGDSPLSATLIAVGGYGREEMHPASDVDLLILLSDEPDVPTQEILSNFVTRLWDLGLEIGHSVRTLDECIDEASNDLTIITNLIESRYLAGTKELFDQLHSNITPDKIWSSAEFFNAKIEEQKQRYKRFGDTAYRVEPNLKEGPGGLRDLQTIGWIALREYGIDSLKKLSESNSVDRINPEEYQALIKARNFLWKVRFVLHQLTNRKEDRLLFDHQRHLAHSFGFTNDEHNQSIESFMQLYYQNITELERLNEIIIGLLRSHILQLNKITPIKINQYYNNQNGYLGLNDKNLFKEHSHTLLEVFFIIQTVPELKGMTPETIRELRANLYLIDDTFRNNVYNKQIFINILSEKSGITFVMHRMNRYGVLAAYIPAFANIVGRMQYDLFHAYTVDEHTLKVVRNVRHLSTDKGAAELPFCSRIFKNVEKPILIYLGALFHDIAKGRGGSHSELGAKDAYDFCINHDLDEYDAQTVSWLVKHHLLISGTSQRKDISDPDVIKELANTVLTQNRLDALYLLTICDIKGTNPTLLNNWKHSLLKDLYRSTKRYLQGHTSNTESNTELANKKKLSVLSSLEKEGLTKQECELFWNRFKNAYILQYSVSDLVWHLLKIIKGNNGELLIDIRESERKDSSALLIYTKDTDNLFIKITAAIEQQHLNIVAARITSSNDGYDLYTFFLLDSSNQPIRERSDQQQLLKSVEKNLLLDELLYNFDHHHIPRQLKHFDSPTNVRFSQDELNNRTIITIRTVDTPGLLTKIALTFKEQLLEIHDAKISTLGEIAEDIFHVTTKSGKTISDAEKQQEIRQALIEKLD